jgi:hypothetical protein
MAFTNPYTDPRQDKSGFIVKDAIKGTFPQTAMKMKVGVMASQGFTQPFKDKFTAAVITELKTQAELDAMLKAGTLDAVFTGNSEQKVFMAANSGYSFVHTVAFSHGVAYGCHAGEGTAVKEINKALTELKSGSKFDELCKKYPTIACDLAPKTTKATTKKGAVVTTKKSVVVTTKKGASTTTVAYAPTITGSLSVTLAGTATLAEYQTDAYKTVFKQAIAATLGNGVTASDVTVTITAATTTTVAGGRRLQERRLAQTLKISYSVKTTAAKKAAVMTAATGSTMSTAFKTQVVAKATAANLATKFGTITVLSVAAPVEATTTTKKPVASQGTRQTAVMLSMHILAVCAVLTW